LGLGLGLGDPWATQAWRKGGFAEAPLFATKRRKRPGWGEEIAEIAVIARDRKSKSHTTDQHG
jgi:hypothetical protein